MVVLLICPKGRKVTERPCVIESYVGNVGLKVVNNSEFIIVNC